MPRAAYIVGGIVAARACVCVRAGVLPRRAANTPVWSEAVVQSALVTTASAKVSVAGQRVSSARVTKSASKRWSRMRKSRCLLRVFLSGRSSGVFAAEARSRVPVVLSNCGDDLVATVRTPCVPVGNGRVSQVLATVVSGWCFARSMCEGKQAAQVPLWILL